MTRLVPLACLVLLLANVGAQPSPSDSESPPFLYTLAKSYEPLAWMKGKDRFPKGALIVKQQGTQSQPLLGDFHASADPAVSFDGSRVLFAGKKQAHDRWEIWEVELSGGGARRITSCPGDCIRPLYLPEDRIVYAELVQRQFVIKLANLTDGKSTPLTFASGSFLPTDVLRDGRILFAAAFPLGSGSMPELYTVYSDGSGVESYRCDHGPARHAGRQLASGDIVFASQTGVARFTSALAHHVDVSVPPREYAGEISELPNGNWLLSSRENSHNRFQISRWTQGSPDLQSVVSNEHESALQPTLIELRPVPNRHPSALQDWNYANLLCLNAYSSKPRLPEAATASVRLYARNPSGRETLLGTTSVEHDGSFYLRAPADQPIKIELLDQSGKTLRREEGWFWLRRGEQRICVGCHAGPETAPENAVPAVLLRSTVPADMTGRLTHSPAGGR